jgi:hypothetical protein
MDQARSGFRRKGIKKERKIVDWNVTRTNNLVGTKVEINLTDVAPEPTKRRLEGVVFSVAFTNRRANTPTGIVSKNYQIK